MRGPRTSWICSSGLVRAGELFSGAGGWGCTRGGVPPPRRSVPGHSARLGPWGGRGEGVVNEVMEATNQEVITLESNLPRFRHGRCRGARRAAGQRRAQRRPREPGRRAAGKLGTRGGRVARCAPAAEEPGSECGCCLSAAPATLSGRRGRSARGRGRRAPR